MLMKRNVLHLLLFMLLLSISCAAEGQIKEAFTGKWYFECPAAPEGFNTGIIDIHKDSIFTAYPGISYRFPSTWIKAFADSINYNVDINGENVLFTLHMESSDKLRGKAATEYGESPMILTRRPDQKVDSLKLKK